MDEKLSNSQNTEKDFWDISDLVKKNQPTPDGFSPKITLVRL